MSFKVSTLGVLFVPVCLKKGESSEKASSVERMVLGLEEIRIGEECLFPSLWWAIVRNEELCTIT
jgi:hypothetical protein